MAQSRSIIFSFVVVFTMCVFTSIGIAGMKGEVLKESGMQLIVFSGKNGISIEAVIYTREGEAQNPTGQLRQFERRQLLVDLQPLHIGPPVFLTFLRNVKDEQGRVDTRLAICQTDRIAHVLEGLSLGKQLWSTPGTIFIFQKPAYFGSYYFVPVEKSSLYFLLVKDKGAVYLYGQGKIMYKGKLLLSFDEVKSRESIVQLVKSPHALERLSAVIASAHLWLFDKTNKEDYLHYLESGLQDIDWNVRRAAVFSLETLSSTASLPLLQKRIQDEKNEYVKAALEKAIAFLQNKVSQEKK